MFLDVYSMCGYEKVIGRLLIRRPHGYIHMNMISDLENDL